MRPLYLNPSLLEILVASHSDDESEEISDISAVPEGPSELSEGAAEARALLGQAALRALASAHSLSDGPAADSGETTALLAGLSGPASAWLSHELVAAGIQADHIMLRQ